MSVIVAYHSTSLAHAEEIVRRGGFRVPTRVEESATDSSLGVFYPAIFFARKPENALYGDVVFKAELRGRFMRWLPARRNESLADRLSRSLERARSKGLDGVDPEYDTVGIAVINPAAITVVDSFVRGEQWARQRAEVRLKRARGEGA